MSAGGLSRPGSAEFVPPRRLPGLHGLRALAACAIVVLHTIRVPQPWLLVPHALAASIIHLRNGVALFFIISAFSLLYSNVGIVGRRGWVAVYLIKRFFRIAPLFYAMLVFYLLLSAHRNYSYDLGQIIANFLFAFNFVPDWHQSIVWAGWTIGVEMPFYLCVPLILIGIRNVRQAWLLVIVTAAISTASRIVLSHSSASDELSLMALTSNLIIFALGVLAFHVAQERTPRWLCPLLALFSIGGLLLTSFNVISLLAVYKALNAMTFATPVSHTAKVLLDRESLNAMVFAVPLATLCLWQAIAPSRWLTIRPLQWMGERSYSIYLLHPFITQQFSQRGTYSAIDTWSRPWLGNWAFLISVALTLATVSIAAAVAYQLIERPGQRLGTLLIHRLFGQTNAPLPVAAAASHNP